MDIILTLIMRIIFLNATTAHCGTRSLQEEEEGEGGRRCFQEVTRTSRCKCLKTHQQYQVELYW